MVQPKDKSIHGAAEASRTFDRASSSGALPEKKYFKIGDVAHLVGVEPHVLRYWETQFAQVRPHKARSGHRLYRRREVETLLAIRELLHVQRFTIAGARQALKQPGGVGALTSRPVPAHGNDTLLPSTIDATLDDGEVVSKEEVSMEVVGLGALPLHDAMEAQRFDGVSHLAIDVVAGDVDTGDSSAVSKHSSVDNGDDAATTGWLSAQQHVRAALHIALTEAHALIGLLDRADQTDARRSASAAG